MPESQDVVVWLVGRAPDVGTAEQRLDDLDATIEETWPAGASAAVVALVRCAAMDADRAVGSLGAGVRRFVDASVAREVAAALAASS